MWLTCFLTVSRVTTRPHIGQAGQHLAVNLSESLTQERRRLEGIPEHRQPPAGRSACAALAAPATGSTQCQACPATTASNARLAGSEASNAATSTLSPFRR